MFTLYEACDLLDRGLAFARVVPFLANPADEAQLRHYFVYGRLPDDRECLYSVYDDTPTPRPASTPRSAGQGMMKAPGDHHNGRPRHVPRFPTRSIVHRQNV